MTRWQWLRGLALGVGIVLGAPDGRADVPPPGEVAVTAELAIDWGPLAGKLARPETVAPGDTWETLANRTTGDARWAGFVRRMNGDEDAPRAGATAWVPPRGQPAGGDSPWWSAFLDCTKYGPSSDVSRSWRRLDPGAETERVFGTVTVALYLHSSIDDGSRSAAIAKASPRAALAATGPDALLVARPSWDARTSVEASSPVRRTVASFRCDGVDGRTLGLTPTGARAYGADGRELAGPVADGRGLPPEGVAGVAAIVVLAALLLVVARRRRSSRGVGSHPG